MDMELNLFTGERAVWDNFVSTSPYGHFMQSYAWGALQGQGGWEPHYLMLRDGSAIRGAVLLLARAIPGLGRVYYAPRGPVVDVADREACMALGSGLRDYLNRTRGVFLRADPYLEQSQTVDEALGTAGFSALTRTWSYWNAPRYVFWLDLQTDEETLFKRLSSTCRNEVRSGYKKGVVYGVGGVDDMADFYRLMVSMGQNKGVAVHDADYYRRLYLTLNESCQVQLFTGRFEDAVIAVGMSVKYGAKAWLLYAASDRDHYKLRANRSLQWEMIKWAHATDCRRYDFRGTATLDPPDPKAPGYGVYEFKKSFGPEFVRLTGYRDLVSGNVMYRAFRFGEEKLLPQMYRAKLWLDERRASKRVAKS